VVNVVTKGPSFKPEATVEVSAGDHGAIGGKAVIGGPIQDGMLAYRASVFSESATGPFEIWRRITATPRSRDAIASAGACNFSCCDVQSVGARQRRPPAVVRS